MATAILSLLQRVLPVSAQQAQPVAGEDAGHVVIAEAPVAQHRRQALQVSDRVQVTGGLLGAEPTVQVGADTAVSAGPRKLGDVVDVIDHGLQGGARLLFAGRQVTSPSRVEPSR